MQIKNIKSKGASDQLSDQRFSAKRTSKIPDSVLECKVHLIMHLSMTRSSKENLSELSIHNQQCITFLGLSFIIRDFKNIKKKDTNV